MIFAFLGISLFFIALGYLITENNARFLLAGYNTMRPEERAKIDLKSYLARFKKFHLWLGLSYFAGGVLLLYLAGDLAAGLFLVLYPLVAYLYFALAGHRHSGAPMSRLNRLAVYVLLGALAFVSVTLALGLRSDPLKVESGRLEFTGSNAETLLAADIHSVELTDSLPEFSMRVNGFALGPVRKGLFRTTGGSLVKLVLNTDAKPYLLVTKSDGGRIFYSAKKPSNAEVFENMKQALPGVEFKVPAE
ncbi:MAG: DUF3784 domain-containing protein [Saprospiraceae bacterium]|nr:DUF3784 domain-containing protein [Saprospiraceae bacterium]